MMVCGAMNTCECMAGYVYRRLSHQCVIGTLAVSLVNDRTKLSGAESKA